jgi:chorismate dehydratase
VALIPSVEYFRGPEYSIVSNACVACRGPVLSVKLHFRVDSQQVRRVALDEGSRTSAALTQILLAELCGVRPLWEPLPIGCGLEATDADAVLLIGDRAISSSLSPQPKALSPFLEVWDLGERWSDWTGLPFVFAMWVARTGVDPIEVGSILVAARDRGVRRLAEIASREAPPLGISVELATRYMSDNLHFKLGADERAGLRKFYELCVAHGIAPAGLSKSIENAGATAAYR